MFNGLLGTAPARAGPPADDDDSDDSDDQDDRNLDQRLDDLAERVGDLERENAELKERSERLEEDQAFTEQRLQDTSRLAARLSGYFDGGFFVTQGEGTGVRSDLGHRLFPEYAGIIPDQWVFVGDPLSTTVNARGEPADTGPSKAILFDSAFFWKCVRRPHA